MIQKDINDMEQSLLGCYASFEDCFDGVLHLVSENLFNGSNRLLYNLIKANHVKKLQSDVMLLNTQLKAIGVEQSTIHEIIKAVSTNNVSSVNVHKFVMMLFENYTRNTLAPLFQYSSERLLSGNDVFEEIEHAKNAISAIEFQVHNVSKEKSIEEIVNETIAEIEKDCTSTSEMLGQSTGLPPLDKISGGLTNETIIIAATAGTGKTALLINIIYENALKNNFPVLFFSLEMTAIQVTKRLLSHALTINNQNIKRGNLLEEDLNRIKAYKTAFKSNLEIDETSGITWQYVEAKVRKKRKTIPMEQLLVVAIDYVQLMRSVPEEERGKSKEESVSTRANNLARIQKTYNLCLLEVSQFSREVTRRAIPKPIISDLKDSSSWENNAHQIWMAWRPELHGHPTDEKGNSLKGLVEIIIGKNREGSLGQIYSRFLGAYSQYKPHIEDAEITDQPF